MVTNKNKPVAVTSNFFQIGTPAYPAYLSIGEYAMIIEGGIGATADLIIDQLKEMGIKLEQIKYVALTHTHPDHIGAIPHWKLRAAHSGLLPLPEDSILTPLPPGPTQHRSTHQVRTTSLPASSRT